MSWITSPESWISLITLTVLELVLGIDNIIFITILAGKLPASQRNQGRTVGLMLALVTRILLLLSISFLAQLTEPLINLHNVPLLGDIHISGRDLILIVGGLFLIYKSTHEIHQKLEGEEHLEKSDAKKVSFTGVVIQIMLLDIVFSLDSVITAIGMAKHVEIMIIAVVIALIIMLFASGPLGDFVNRHPTVKMLALAFLLLIGTSLIAEGFHKEIEKAYIYFAMAFSVFVEMLNLRARSKQEPVQLRQQQPH